MPFTAWQSAFDLLLSPGARNYWKSHDFSALSDAAIDVLLRQRGFARVRLVAMLVFGAICAAAIFAAQPVRADVLALGKADRVVVIKSEHRLYLIREGAVIAVYRVALGPNPRGHKVFEGDGRTPEGDYILERKNEKSRFHRSIRISYPNSADRARARTYGASAGGDIIIHGEPAPDNTGALKQIAMTPLNWTDGCIAVENWAMDEIWSAVDGGTVIEILP